MTEDAKWKRMEELYNLAQSRQIAPPKHVLFAWKCPKCNSKLNKESFQQAIYSTEEGNEFVKRVASEAGLAPGIYQLSIDHFTCKCGYEFTKANTGMLTFDI